ncbi:MAG: hypothetical protein ACFFGZ_14095 [Candidatus Thorarchaeota archaeon]
MHKGAAWLSFPGGLGIIFVTRRRNVNEKSLGYLLAIGVALSFLALQPLMDATTTPVSTLVVKMDSDATVDAAANTLKAYLPHAVVVEHNTMSALLMSLHPIQHVILVGHGFEEGVATNEGLMTWRDYAAAIALYSASAYYLLNCRSAKVQSELPTAINDRVLLSFGLDIDARIAAMLTSLTIHALNYNLDEAMVVFDALQSLASDILTGIVRALPLGYVPYMYRMGWNELGHWIIEIVKVVLPMVIGPLIKVIASKLGTIGSKVWAKIGPRLSSSSSEASRLSRIIKALKSFWTNWGDAIGLAWEIFGFFSDYLDFIIAAITESLTWYEALLYAASLVATLVGLFVTGGWSTVLTIVASIWDVYLIIRGLYYDWNDYGDVPYT